MGATHMNRWGYCKDCKKSFFLYSSLIRAFANGCPACGSKNIKRTLLTDGYMEE
jgi:DNA-directed RNA polymerase subunit RPC12/RpoP